jgi:DICT domain-containing protein
MSRHLEEQALSLGDTPVVLATFQEAERFTPATADRYEKLAARVALVGAMGVGMPAEPVRGVRGATMNPDDPLRGEWVVAVVGAHFAGAFAALDLGDAGPDMERRFTYSVTHDRDLVLRIARSLMGRLEHDRHTTR